MKIGALIPIRLESERLPGKILKEICGRSVFSHLLDRVFSSKFLLPKDVIVCTTLNRSDDLIVEEATKNGVRFFRGSENDIIDRFWGAAEENQIDIFIEVDGDDPCSEPSYMDFCVEELINDRELGIAFCQGLPLGIGTKAIRTAALKKIWDSHLTNRNDTGFIYYFTKTDLVKKKAILPKQKSHINDKARLTLDYEEDLIFFNNLFKNLYHEGKIFGIEEIIQLLDIKPELVEINAFRSKDFWKRTTERALLEFRTVEGKTEKIEA
ncbi:MAG: hypothetical protein HQM08_02870 [Candidatus Riflebacteria bacterium]|nr:hypothetical protein [Candidatus Riflebacteria bacterium]